MSLHHSRGWMGFRQVDVLLLDAAAFVGNDLPLTALALARQARRDPTPLP